MRLKKSSQALGNGAKTEGSSTASVCEDLKSSHHEHKKMFVRPFEDNYHNDKPTKSTDDAVSCTNDTNHHAINQGISLNNYTPPEHRFMKKEATFHINLSIPVSLQSNLKQISAVDMENVQDTKGNSFDIGNNETNLLLTMSGRNTLINNNNNISTEQVSCMNINVMVW